MNFTTPNENNFGFATSKLDFATSNGCGESVDAHEYTITDYLGKLDKYFLFDKLKKTQ